jgi:predicted permease
VERAAIGNCPPLAGGCNGTVIWFRDRPPVPEGTEPSIGVHHVSPEWFATLGVPLLRGRVFTDADRIGTPKVVVINQTAARRFWPNEDPIGKPVAVGQGGFHDRAEVIGIVGDVRFGTAVDRPQPDVFLSYLQSPRSTAMLFLRAATSAPAVVGGVRELVRALDPSMPIYEVRSMSDRVRRATVRERFTSGVLTGFAGMALLLATIGVYALIAHEVARRTREIGIRMTLGADPGAILTLVLRRGAVLAGVGLVIGLGAALGLARLLRALLFQVEPSDPGTYLTVGLVLGVAALLATLAPALRATRVHPMEAIRTE